MSATYNCSESDFKVVKPKAALAALKAANEQAPFFEGDPDAAPGIERAQTLGRALEACGWEVELLAGKIDKLFYDGAILGDFDEDLVRLFRVLAPFVRSGSYLELSCTEYEVNLRFEFRRGGLKIRDIA
jgi:hypothetical protein